MNNKVLLGIFALLLFAFLGSKMFSGKNKKGNFNPEVVVVDTAAVDLIKIFPKEGSGEPFNLTKSGGKWMASKEGKTVPAISSTVQSLLTNMQRISSTRIVSKSPDKFANYEVVEGKATRIQVSGSGQTLADFLVGSFKFDQATRSASSYIRNSDDNSVYVVDGFLSMNFNQQFDNFRDKTIMTVNQADITGLSLEQGGEAINFQKQPDGWFFNGMEKIDSASMAQYLSSIANVTGASFADDFNAAAASSPQVLKINANNVLSSLVLKGYATTDGSNQYIVHSSLNPDAHFASDSSGVYQRIFTKLNELIP